MPKKPKKKRRLPPQPRYYPGYYYQEAAVAELMLATVLSSLSAAAASISNDEKFDALVVELMEFERPSQEDALDFLQRVLTFFLDLVTEEVAP